MDELMAQFIVEARELVQSAIDDLFALAADPNSHGRLDGAFRAVHTLKGSAGLFDLLPMQSVLHQAEDNLGLVRSGTAVLDAGQIDAIVAVLEWVDACVDDLEQAGAIRPPRLDNVSQLQAALGLDQDLQPVAPNLSTPAAIGWAIALSAQVGGNAAIAVRYRPHPECFFSGDDPVALVSQVPGLLHLSIGPREPWPAPGELDPFRSNLVFEMLSAASLGDIEAIFRLVPDQVEIVPLGAVTAPPQDDQKPDVARVDTLRSLRVDPGRIDALLDTVGELITTKNRMSDLFATANALEGGTELARAIAATQKDLDRLAGALYGDVLRTRMVPLSQAFTRLPRMVRDLSRRLGKPTDLLIEGSAVEADKTIVDGLFEPLLHLIRNAMDHGIEIAADRSAAGKPAAAKLALHVIRQGDKIIVSLSDDGRGINPDAVRMAAIRKGILSAESAAGLDRADTLELLFAPGFSTAAKVNDLSGRGVGLDAVRTEIVRLGGTVDLTSQPGAGTTIALHLPMSLAMTQLLVVSVRGEFYGVPMQAVVETVRVKPAAITPIRGNRAFVLRDRTVPLLSLSALLDLPDDAVLADDLTVLVLAIGDQQVGIAIDAISERVETITRPLGGLLTGLKGIAGTTMLGNGRVLLVLDVKGLVE
jgi:two-component system chemotaxis sensor kinase CheA